MDKKPSWWQRRKIGFLMGETTAPWVDLGWADEIVIRYKDKFISVLEDPETGEIKSLSWADNADMFPATNINDYWVAAQQ